MAARPLALAALLSVAHGRRAAGRREAFPALRLAPTVPLSGAAAPGLLPTALGVGSSWDIFTLGRRDGPSLMHDMAVTWVGNIAGAPIDAWESMHDAPPVKGLRNALRQAWVFAKDLGGLFTRVRIPKDWSPMLSQHNLRLLSSLPHSKIYIGSSKSGRIAMKVAKSGARASNEVDMLRRVRGSGNVVAYLASEEFPDETYIAMDCAEDSLYDYMKRWREANGERMPLSESLPILVDLLRAARDLEALHIVHGSIWEGDVLMKHGRPLLASFGLATVVRGSDDDIGYAAVSLFEGRQLSTVDVVAMPPETIRGLPTGPSNNVYQVGAVFASMSLAFPPVYNFLANAVPEAEGEKRDVEGWNATTVDRAQDVVRRRFSLQNSVGYQSLEDTDVRDILTGLLATSVDRRWTATGALQEVLAIAARRGIAVPPERAPPAAAAAWASDWE